MSSIQFVKSAVHAADYPPDRGVEVAIAGRSNAGKSSLINALTGAHVAKVSGTPGKTRLLNFFNINKKYVLVDMPGYGFAARAKTEVEDWQTMIETYLSSRRCLQGLVLVMDIRREWEEEEETLRRFTDLNGLPLIVALTKTDKLSRNEIAAAVRKIEKLGLAGVFAVSNSKKTGHKDLDDWIYKNWVKSPSRGIHE